MLLTRGETLAEVRNYSEFSIIFFLSKKTPTPQSLASTWIKNDLWNRGKCRTGAGVNNYFTLIKAASCSGPQWFRNVFKFATDLRVRATEDSTVLLLPDFG